MLKHFAHFHINDFNVRLNGFYGESKQNFQNQNLGILRKYFFYIGTFKNNTEERLEMGCFLYWYFSKVPTEFSI